MSGWEAVIGIETHVELQTRSKMFCGCAVDFGAEPNTTVCPVCLALPGALPVPNQEAIEGILSIGAAFECELVTDSLFHRKNYFYPDLPKNYQISQYDVPLCVNGHLDVEVEGEEHRIGITRVHMEEDTGKSLHGSETGRIHDAEYSLLDFNRSGVPLVEIVSEPDIRSPEQARAYAAELQRVVRSLGVSDVRLEEGSVRFDANISVRPVGQAEYGTRAEVKNMNSLRSLQRAVAYEIERQIAVIEGGGEIVQETRHWDEGSGKTSSMRSKEESEDYRYFQEPDLVPLHVDDEWRERVVAGLPELPAVRRHRIAESGVDRQAAAVMVEAGDLADLFDDAVAGGADPRTVGNWLSGDVVAYLRRNDTTLQETHLSGAHLQELAEMVREGALSSTAAKDVLGRVLQGEGTPAALAAKHDLIQISDSGELEAEVDAVLAANVDVLGKIRGGDMKPIGFLVGQVMKATRGKADPKVVSELIRTKAAEG
ncbi:MAG: Asp-tRNA(Asn)/Glu-tRNA(Gln) amidotransferase subunit GatB [Acidimicrobiia bacterium]|nr:Asp-tRNA(Asn)/Glu-tRNA(Gln) amidotransferase subunit GatB [Acidimicrobiia bacterium]